MSTKKTQYVITDGKLKIIVVKSVTSIVSKSLRNIKNMFLYEVTR